MPLCCPSTLLQAHATAHTHPKRQRPVASADRRSMHWLLRVSAAGGKTSHLAGPTGICVQDATQLGCRITLYTTLTSSGVMPRLGRQRPGLQLHPVRRCSPAAVAATSTSRPGSRSPPAVRTCRAKQTDNQHHAVRCQTCRHSRHAGACLRSASAAMICTKGTGKQAVDEGWQGTNSCWRFQAGSRAGSSRSGG